MKISKMKVVVLLALVMSGLFAGCCPPASPENQVLEGTWAVTVASNPDLKQLLVTFDSNGKVTAVSYQLGTNAVATVNSPVGTAVVEGQSVTITGGFNGNALTFTGTLNDANTVITGNLTTTITQGSTTITINNGAATLTKQ